MKLNEYESIIYNKNRTADFIVRDWEEFYNIIKGTCDFINQKCCFTWQHKPYNLDSDTFIEAIFSPLNVSGEVVCTITKAIDPEQLDEILTAPLYAASPLNRYEKNKTLILNYFKDGEVCKYDFPVIYNGRLIKRNIVSDSLSAELNEKAIVYIILDSSDDMKAAKEAYEKEQLLSDKKELEFKFYTIDELYYEKDCLESVKHIFHDASVRTMPVLIEHMKDTFQIKLHNPLFDWNNVASNLSYCAYFNILSFFYSKNRKVQNPVFSGQTPTISSGREEFKVFVDIGVKGAYINLHEGKYLMDLADAGFVEFIENGNIDHPPTNPATFHNIPDGHWTLDDYIGDNLYSTLMDRLHQSRVVDFNMMRDMIKANLKKLSGNTLVLLDKKTAFFHFYPYSIFEADDYGVLVPISLYCKSKKENNFNINKTIINLKSNIEHYEDVHEVDTSYHADESEEPTNIFEWFRINIE